MKINFESINLSEMKLSLTRGLVDWLVVGVKVDCLTRDLGLWVEYPPWESSHGSLSKGS